MLNLLASALRKKLLRLLPQAISASAQEEALSDDCAPVYESLAMTDELREALFPKSPQMISAIFDRPAPLVRPPMPSPVQAATSREFPLIF
jgi:hypothetical protein